MTDSNRCTVMAVDLRDIGRAVADPALASLLREGWTVIATVVLDADDGAGPRLQVILGPPRPVAPVAPVVPTSPAIPWWLTAAVVGVCVLEAVRLLLLLLGGVTGA